MNLFEHLPSQWRQALPEAKSLLEEVVLSQDFIPAIADVFHAFIQPISEIRVCIVGQDPYPNSEDAMGLAFSVPSEKSALPASLRNIFKELESDLGVSNSSGDLSSWQNQGVMLLNRVLTTEPGSSNAHRDIGWEEFTELVIKYLAKREVIFVLWGNQAKEFSHLINPNLLIEGVHPSPLSAYKGFFGAKPFSEVNARLSKLGLGEIDWRT